MSDDEQGRAETGPMQFEGDWPGVFLRGDYAGPMAMCLRQVIEQVGDKVDPFAIAYVKGLADTLAESDVRSGAEVQKMKPWGDAKL